MYKPKSNPKIEVGKSYHFNENGLMCSVKILVTHKKDDKLWGHYITEDKVGYDIPDAIPVIDLSDASTWYQIPSIKYKFENVSWGDS